MDTSKVIRGVVNSGKYTVTAPIVKEDYGLYLQIEGVELPSTYEVDFSNSESSGTSVTMIGNSDGVLIPRQFIDTGKDIFAFLYHVGADFGRTVYKFRIPNKVRPDRTNEEPTPEEQSVIDQAISALNSAVAQTAQDVIDADASAQSAQGYAEQAEDARDNAQTYANNAQASATSASQSATASANSASASAQIKADVEDLVDDAQGYAQASAQSASASAQSASDAQGYAQSASASETNAQGYASQAQTSAQTASAKAQDASGYAQTATQKATESAQSASQALTYKTDAETAKTASQTAHGKAEDAQTAAETAQGLAESARDDAIQAKNDAESAVASISGALADKAPIITDTASGAIASFTDGADDLPLKSLVVDINPIQDLSHGDPSPENICPISGWTEVDVEQSGKNIAMPKAYLMRISTSIPYIGDMTEIISPYTTPYTWCGVGFIAYVKKGVTYTLSSDATGTQHTIIYGVYPDIESAIDRSNVLEYGGTNISVTPNHDGLLVFMRYSQNQGTVVTWTYGQCELGSTDTPYEPYTGRSITIDLGQTVYGGHLDVLSGELVIDMAMVDLGTLDWGKYVDERLDVGYYFWSSNLTNVKVGSTHINTKYTDYNGVGLTTIIKNVGASVNNILWNVPNGTNVYVIDSAYTDAAAFKSAMSGVQLCYELATPIEVQLSANQINSLYGVNNIWADSGDTEVEYRADTKLFIERLTAPDSADMIADANITSGKYFMVGNSLYKATANIANGASIIVGTNCIRKSLSEALNEINA